MEWLVNAKEMKVCDTNTIDYFGVPSVVLMERAALQTVELIETRRYDTRRILVVCGTGNNGGDGFAIARMLFLKHIQVELLLIGDAKRLTKEANTQYQICRKYEIPLIEEIQDEYTLVIDALFGIGVSRNLEGTYLDIIEQMNGLHGVKLAVDIPSGISADNGSVMGAAIRADVTVTFGYRKLGLVLYPGAQYAGEVVLADIGITEHSWLQKKPGVMAMEKMDLNRLMRRTPEGNKGTFGKVLVIGGSVNMAGAAYFSAKAAYKSGCGLVRIYTTEENRTMLQTRLPEAILTTYAKGKADNSKLTEALSWADVIIIGPGMGTDETARNILELTLKNAAVPVVIDADACNLLAKDAKVLLNPHTDLILTPHLGEMARLSGRSVSYLKENAISFAEEFAREYDVVCVLKDARTVVAIPYGRTYLNLSGNDGMATAGSGDVLSGIIGGLIAQGLHAELAAPAGVYWHGMAGNLAVQERGRHGVMAETIIEYLIWKDTTEVDHETV